MADSLPLEDLLEDWETSLEAKNRSQQTIVSYKLAVRQLWEFLGSDTAVDEVTRNDIEAFLAAMQKTHASATVRQRYASLKQWFGWLAKLDPPEVPSNPIDGIDPPKIDEKPVPVIPLETLRSLLKACKKDPNRFLALRDEAIIRLFIDAGIRLEEMAGIKTSDIDKRLRTVVVLGKGRRFRTVAFDVQTAEAIAAYDRQRKRNKHVDIDHFWIGRQGRLSSSAIAQMVKRRSREAGIEPHIHPHQFRHTFAHQWLAQGGNEGDLQQMAGWSSPQMLQRYGSSAAEQRAQEAHRRLGLWEDL